MIEWKDFLSERGVPAPYSPPKMSKRRRRKDNRYLSTSLLCLAIGGLCAGPALAHQDTHQDTTPPLISVTVNGVQGANGWYIDDVSVSWTVSDPESKIKSKSGCDDITLATDTSGITYTCKARSRGGISHKSVTVKRDATPPKAAINTPSSGTAYRQNDTLTASYNCTDSTSEIATCTGTVADGATIDTSTVGVRTFSVQATDRAGNATNTAISYTVGEGPVSSAKGTYLFAWNDLGMHCTDSDFSVFTLLPPFNNLNAQLVVNGKLIDAGTQSGYHLTYRATPDPTGSINSTSYTKTNFWDYTQPLFGISLMPDTGLTGNPTASNTPAPMSWEGSFNWFEATGIPITPTDDNLNTNYFPMVTVSAHDDSGREIASSTAVLPVSSEINCQTCHASATGSSEARPAAGWVNLTADPEQDWRLNILRLHDEKNAGPSYATLLTEKGYGEGLESSAYNGKPTLCDSCHNSNALAVWGIPGTAGVSDMTAAMHTRHASVTVPGTNQTLDSIGTRNGCYKCHPGEKTQCLRGAMGNPIDSTGQHAMECQSCHGSMATVGNRARDGWFDMPTCQSCHHDGKRETTAINSDGTFKTWSDTRFASNADTPSPGFSLYRFSTGHGKVQCEACHNATHAEFTDKPSESGNQANDNLQAVNAQGYAAAIRECTVCHASMPNSPNGGPHGMHNLGQSWVESHHDAINTVSRASCSYCHGSTSSGSALAVIKVQKTFNIEERGTKTFAAGERVTCWSCHNGPNS